MHTKVDARERYCLIYCEQHNERNFGLPIMNWVKWRVTPNEMVALDESRITCIHENIASYKKNFEKKVSSFSSLKDDEDDE